jgi:hypothetical protein
MTPGVCRDKESVQKGGLNWQREYSEGRHDLEEPEISILA